MFGILNVLCSTYVGCWNQVPFPKELWDKVSDDAKDFIKVRRVAFVEGGSTTI